MKSAKKILWKGLLVVLLGIFLGVFIFAAYQLYYTFNGYRQATKKYDSLNEQFVSTQPQAAPTPEVPEETPEVFTAPITIDFDGLKERKCSRCGAKDTEVTKAHGHTFNGSFDISKPATCTESGLKVGKCDKCGYQVIDESFRTNFCPNCGADMREES